MASSNIFTLTAMVVLVVLMASPTRAQNSCANALVPCAGYLQNNDKPSTECCSSINETVTNQLACLCNLYFTPGLLESLGANTTSALRIATDCGVSSVGVDQCKAVTGQAPTVSPPPPAVPGGGGSGAGKVAWTGLPALLLFWAAVMYY